jgi:hypothetical protein
LQQVKCGAARSLEESEHSSIQRRIRAWVAQQADEVVEEFKKKKIIGGEYDLPPEVVKTMLADSWMMPFSGDSPLLLMRKEEPTDASSDNPAIIVPIAASDSQIEPKHTKPVSTPEVDGPEVNDVPKVAAPEVAAPEVDAPEVDAPKDKETGHNGKARKQKARKQKSRKGKADKTFELHRKFLDKPQDLTMRRPILDMPRGQYLQMAQLAAEAWKQVKGSPDDGMIDPASPPRMSPKATIGTFNASVKQFREFVHGAAEDIPLLRSMLARGDPPPVVSES